MSFTQTVIKYIYSFISSSHFYYALLTWFGLSAAFIATTSLYPMAFDEEFHLGLIKIYTGSWFPYGISHTSDMAQYGAATADASYLFHYFMSFPYRIFAALGLSEQMLIILLRLINIGFVIASLLVFKKAFDYMRVTPGVSNIALCMVTLIPVFVMLAAQINYDNLLLLIFAWSIYFIARITATVRRNGTLPLYESWLLALSLLIGMSIKYAFLPLALGIFIWFVAVYVTSLRTHKRNWLRSILMTFRQWFSFSNTKQKLLLVCTVLSVFFAAHYATNIVSYGSPIPSCDQVFTEDQCRAYGPWNRNKMYIATKSQDFTPLSFPGYMASEWFPGMTERLTFAVAGKSNDFQTKKPLPIIMVGFIILSVIGAVCFALALLRRRLHWLAWLTALLCVVYVAVLSVQLYGDYVNTGQPVAINGRYLLPLLPLVAVVLIQSIRTVLRTISSEKMALLASAVLVLLLAGGAGAGTYILQSESHWYWPGFGQAWHESVQSIFKFVTLAQKS